MTARTRKRRRSMVVTSSDAALPLLPFSPWESLPGDILLLIAWRVLAGDFLDYVRLRAVCSSWRSVIVSPRGRGVTDRCLHPRRWMLLPEGHDLHPGHGKLRGYVRFFNLDMGALVRVHLPLFRNHCALESVDGLLLLQRDEDTAVRLLHPFTGDIVELPPLDTLLTQLEDDLKSQSESGKWFYIRFGICAAVSCGDDGTITAIISSQRLSRAAFATSRDKRWTMTSWKIPSCVSRLSFQGKIYVVHHERLGFTTQIFRMEPPQQHDDAGGSLPPLPPTLVASCPVIDCIVYSLNLVECESEIFLVGNTNSYSHIVVYKLADITAGRLIPVKSIGGRSLFMTQKALSISAKAFPTAMADTVVYIDTDDDGRCRHYHLSIGTWSPPADECSMDDTDPGPCTIVLHVITCCIRGAWNKGMLYSTKEVCRNGWTLWKVKRKFRQWS